MTVKYDLWIVGAGGFGRELLAMLWEALDPAAYRLQGFLARDSEQTSLASQGIDLPIEADPATYRPRENDRFLLAIGNMDARRAVADSIEGRGGRFVSFIHPRAHLAPTAQIGVGAILYPMSVVSNASVLGPHIHLSYFASVGHDCRLGPYCLLAPYATLNGSVLLEDEVYVSTHASVAPGRRVGRGSKISANSACMQDVPAETMVFGVPGKQVRRMTR